MITPVVSPSHDLALTIDFEELNATTGLLGPMLTGPVTAKLVGMPVGEAPSDVSSTPEDVFDITCSHVGNGRWLAQFDGTGMPAALLEPVFGSGATPPKVPWVVFQASGGGAYAVKCRYEAPRIIAAR